MELRNGFLLLQKTDKLYNIISSWKSIHDFVRTVLYSVHRSLRHKFTLYDCTTVRELKGGGDIILYSKILILIWGIIARSRQDSFPISSKNSTIWRKNASPLLLSKFDYSTAIKFLYLKNSDTFEQNSGISPLSGNSDKMGGGTHTPGNSREWQDRLSQRIYISKRTDSTPLRRP